MNENRSYKVPVKTVTAEQEINKSRFIATAGRVTSRKEAEEFLGNVADKYSDATHNCYVFIAGDPENTTEIGMSDDGEVPGTAAKPMMNLIRHKKIGEIAVVVTRYFGGTKLGTGGLVRAYSSSVQKVLDELPLEQYREMRTGTIEFPYSQESVIRRLFEELQVVFSDIAYTEHVTVKIKSPGDKCSELDARIGDITRGDSLVKWDEK